MRLLIISHTPHYDTAEGIKGWGPTVREIDWLSTLFTSVTHIAIKVPGENVPASSLPYQSRKISLRLLPPAGGNGLREKINILFRYPQYLKTILEEMGTAEMIHVRCPANISLLALLVLMFHPKTAYRWVKYAGNWDRSIRRPFSYAVQKWLLRHNVHRGVVTVNGVWQDQPGHVLPFFNPSYTEAEAKEALETCQQKSIIQPVRLLFVGRLEPEKGVDLIIETIKELQTRGIEVEANIVGSGPMIDAYIEKVSDLGLDHFLSFLGWLPRNEINHLYKNAHFLLLPTITEGWPKVISEGMAYGVVPLASAISCIPQYLTDFGCGRALPVGEVDAYVQAIQEYLTHPETWRMESKAGISAAKLFTYEAYLEKIRQTAKKCWGLVLVNRENMDE